ncbi:MAG: class I SAM-dependent methyltransferase [Acidimicrobiales bacterium]
MTFFDDEIAVRYDSPADPMNSADAIGPVVEKLAELAAGGPVLEFAIGTGRIAVPLSRRGISVSGIELSEPMAAILAAKPESADISVTIGDMAATRVDGEFTLVYLVYNTITNLLEQHQQVACFENAAAHLLPGGRFVIETGVPRLQRLGVGETYLPFVVSDGHIGIDEFDVVAQRLTSHHHWIEEGRSQAFSSTHRYAWPAEYDLMARIAGLELVERWGGWKGEPYTATSRSHVSVWRKPEVGVIPPR